MMKFKIQFEKVVDFFIAFGSLTDANTFGIFGFGRGPPRWSQRRVKFLLIRIAKQKQRIPQCQ
jgi:hypothetical protein